MMLDASQTMTSWLSGLVSQEVERERCWERPKLKTSSARVEAFSKEAMQFPALMKQLQFAWAHAAWRMAHEHRATAPTGSVHLGRQDDSWTSISPKELDTTALKQKVGATETSDIFSWLKMSWNIIERKPWQMRLLTTMHLRMWWTEAKNEPSSRLRLLWLLRASRAFRSRPNKLEVWIKLWGFAGCATWKVRMASPKGSLRSWSTGCLALSLDPKETPRMWGSGPAAKNRFQRRGPEYSQKCQLQRELRRSKLKRSQMRRWVDSNDPLKDHSVQ